jgi:phospholipid transport system substrate-binding protein
MQITMRIFPVGRVLIASAGVLLAAGAAGAQSPQPAEAGGSTPSPAAQRSETPAAYMQRVANELVAASRSRSALAFATALRSHADLPSIGLSALGSYAPSLSKSDRPAYYNGMVNWIARYAAKEAPKYPVAKAVVVGQSQVPGGAYVDTVVTLRDGSSYDIRWKIVRRGSTYKIRDAEILLFQMTSVLGNLFQDYISKNGGNPKALVLALNQ